MNNKNINKIKIIIFNSMYNLKDSSSKFDKPMNKTRVASRECPSRDPIPRDLDKTQTILCFISNCNLTEPFQIQI